MLTIKNVSLSLLTLCMTVQAIIMHISRTDRAPGVPLYKPAAAVILTEVGKLLISSLLAWRECRKALIDESKPDLLAEREMEEKPAQAEVRDSKDEERDNDDAELEATEKLLKSLDAPAASSRRPSPKEIACRIQEDVLGPDWYKLSIPAMLFTAQANLAYYASSNLSVPVFQITYQLKVSQRSHLRAYIHASVANVDLLQIPATALCSVLMLGRALSRLQWGSIALLSLGVGIVQLASSAADAKYHVHTHAAAPAAPGSVHDLPAAGGPAAAAVAGARLLARHVADAVAGEPAGMNQLLGLVAVVLACLSSGFSGVYFEKVLKKKVSAPPPQPISPSEEYASPTSSTALQPPIVLAVPPRKAGLWVRNIQLSLFSLLVGSGIYLLSAPSGAGTLSPAVFFEGFTGIVYCVVGLQITGGLLAAIVIQYADNIAKSFSASVSIILSFAASVWLFNYHLNAGVVAGSAMVVGATWLFSMFLIAADKEKVS